VENPSSPESLLLPDRFLEDRCAMVSAQPMARASYSDMCDPIGQEPDHGQRNHLLKPGFCLRGFEKVQNGMSDRAVIIAL